MKLSKAQREVLEKIKDYKDQLIFVTESTLEKGSYYSFLKAGGKINRNTVKSLKDKMLILPFGMLITDSGRKALEETE